MNAALLLAACLSAIAGLLHVGIILGGPRWYRLFGAGERMARGAEAGRAFPTVITTAIAAMLFVWAAYGLSGAGAIQPLPFLKPALCAITAVYLLRGLALIPLMTFARSKATPFLVWSSMVCLGYGTFHLIGLMQVWNRF